jgi:hypothetical protein
MSTCLQSLGSCFVLYSHGIGLGFHCYCPACIVFDFLTAVLFYVEYVCQYVEFKLCVTGEGRCVSNV